MRFHNSTPSSIGSASLSRNFFNQFLPNYGGSYNYLLVSIPDIPPSPRTLTDAELDLYWETFIRDAVRISPPHLFLSHSLDPDEPEPQDYDPPAVTKHITLDGDEDYYFRLIMGNYGAHLHDDCGYHILVVPVGPDDFADADNPYAVFQHVEGVERRVIFHSEKPSVDWVNKSQYPWNFAPPITLEALHFDCSDLVPQYMRYFSEQDIPLTWSGSVMDNIIPMPMTPVAVSSILEDKECDLLPPPSPCGWHTLDNVISLYGTMFCQECPLCHERHGNVLCQRLLGGKPPAPPRKPTDKKVLQRIKQEVREEKRLVVYKPKQKHKGAKQPNGILMEYIKALMNPFRNSPPSLGYGITGSAIQKFGPYLRQVLSLVAGGNFIIMVNPWACCATNSGTVSTSLLTNYCVVGLPATATTSMSSAATAYASPNCATINSLIVDRRVVSTAVRVTVGGAATSPPGYIGAMRLPNFPMNISNTQFDSLTVTQCFNNLNSEFRLGSSTGGAAAMISFVPSDIGDLAFSVIATANANSNTQPLIIYGAGWPTGAPLLFEVQTDMEGTSANLSSFINNPLNASPEASMVKKYPSPDSLMSAVGETPVGRPVLSDSPLAPEPNWMDKLAGYAKSAMPLAHNIGNLWAELQGDEKSSPPAAFSRQPHLAVPPPSSSSPTSRHNDSHITQAQLDAEREWQINDAEYRAQFAQDQKENPNNP
jgi:hypothetical protein